VTSVEKRIGGCQAPIATPVEESVTRNDSLYHISIILPAAFAPPAL